MVKEETQTQEKPAVKEVIKLYDLIQVPTHHELAFSTPEGDVITLHQAIAVILNTIDRIDKRL